MQVFADFVDFFGDPKFQNKTNGITPRRWLFLANEKLSDLITQRLGTQSWVTNLDQLKLLKSQADDPLFRRLWQAVKFENKKRLAKYISENCGVEVDPEALFDIQVKRIHEYKRQFMNILGVVHRYLTIKTMTSAEKEKCVPRVVIFGGKAAPGYFIAKLVIKLINSVAQVINKDPTTNKLLKVESLDPACFYS
jgi:starch phosphorylase